MKEPWTALKFKVKKGYNYPLILLYLKTDLEAVVHH